MTSAKMMTMAVDVIRRSGPRRTAEFRWDIRRLDAAPDIVAGRARR